MLLKYSHDSNQISLECLFHTYPFGGIGIFL